MNTEQREGHRYMEYQRSRRAERVQALGDVATTLFLATVGLGVLPVGKSGGEMPAKAERSPTITGGEVTSLARRRRRTKLGGVATDSAELGYTRAA